mmetsp:Transcript_1752/g.3647  ORF Transcript_1752/g.3647 Transcript_1752/m.3647 type:complete len:266 (+) Transcript_1752:80-877(+)
MICLILVIHRPVVLYSAMKYHQIAMLGNRSLRFKYPQQRVTQSSSNCLHNSMTLHHILLMNQIRSLLDKIQQTLDIRRPIAQNLFLLPLLLKPDNILRPIDLGIQTPCTDHLRNVFFQIISRKGQKLRQSGEMDATIVNGGDAKVVLNDASVEGGMPVRGKGGFKWRGRDSVVVFHVEVREGFKCGLMWEWVVNDFFFEEGLDCFATLRNFIQVGIHIYPLHHILHFVSVLTQAQENNCVGQSLLQLVLFLLHTVCRINCVIILR